jgi:hypothetical protein
LPLLAWVCLLVQRRFIVIKKIFGLYEKLLQVRKYLPHKPASVFADQTSLFKLGHLV